MLFKSGKKFSNSGFVLKAKFRNDNFKCNGNTRTKNEANTLKTISKHSCKELSTNNKSNTTTTENNDTQTNKQILCKRNKVNIEMDCNTKSFTIIAPWSRYKTRCTVNLSITKSNLEVEIEFLQFNLVKYGGLDTAMADILEFTQGDRNIQYSGVANQVGIGRKRIDIFTGQRVRPPKLRTTYYAPGPGDLNINYFEMTEGGGRNFKMIGLRTYGIKASQEELTQLFAYFDKDGSGSIKWDEFMESFRSEVSEARKSLIVAAFEKLDVNKNGVISVDDLKNRFDYRKDPKYMSGEWSANRVYKELLKIYDGEQSDGVVTLNEFMDYYTNLSNHIPDDSLFEMMMKNSFK
ncbi:DgyrCDS14820 [Dimorphilus gyrociliatus]|uniref:DgyrCDS14820 n=1 Tax=Dimorphilus gyrociliatus TaxID=2664684 RepID=A0A7I8WEZ4_9ANNE|nr:DgyrCDS14820 [Dimorphilus gyrociliatus]